jgi:hypothetical protein
MQKICAAAILAAVCLSASAAESISKALPCAQLGTVGGLGAGTDLTRHVVDNAKFPEAVCNDGTPAVFYYGPYSKPEDRDKWIIFLQGGGSCVDGQSCGERWCSIDTNYGYDKMSTSSSKAQIRGVGFLNPGAENRFGSWNRVLIYYCSSDTWVGTSTRVVTASQGNVTREFEIHFKGLRIVDAVLDTLRNSAPGARRRIARHDAEDAETSPWPDLDNATAVMFAGSSAGGEGARQNLDRVAAKLRNTNPNVVVRGVIDAIYGTQSATRDFTKSTYCANDPARGCSYETFTKSSHEAIDVDLRDARLEDSCLTWHALNAPGTTWQCADGEHVLWHHVTTPFFLRQDLLDEQIGGSYVDAGFGTPSDYARTVESEFRNPPIPEEPHGATPGFFAPQCTDHESFTSNERVFDTKLAGTSWHDAVWNWWTGAQPQQLIRPYTGTPTRAPECPPPN